MQAIYVIYEESGAYSDKAFYMLCCSFSEQRASEIVYNLEKLKEFNKSFNKKLREEFETNWDLNNTPIHYPLKPFRLGPHNKFNDSEHIELIKEWEKDCDLIRAKNYSICEAKVKAREDYIKQNYDPPNELKEFTKLINEDMNYYSDNVWYSYQKVSFI